MTRWAFFLCALGSLVAACASTQGLRFERAERIARAGGLERARLPAGRWTLTAWRRGAVAADGALVVYLEGDGDSWSRDGTRPTRDPTPARPLALELAAADPAPAVAYLARPCQYTERRKRAGCEPVYWAHRRFAPEVIDATDDAIDELVRRAGARRIHLVGYSGGGVVATLVAVGRDDVASLVTLGAPLDVAAWVAHHGVTPLAGSLDPGRGAGPRVPQLHLAGERDTTVPPDLVRAYVEGRTAGDDVLLEVVPGYDHECCWAEGWAGRVLRIRARLVGP